MSALTDLFTSLANKIRSNLDTSISYTPSEAVSAIDDVYSKGLADGATPTQAKSVTATTTAQTVTPDSGYALSSVTVNPQVHSGTYTYASGSTGGTVDLGETNAYRYVNADNVYTKGKADGGTAHTETYTFARTNGNTVDLGEQHAYRYVNASNVLDYGYRNAHRILRVAPTAIPVGATKVTTKAGDLIFVIVPDETLSSVGLGAITNAKCIFNDGYVQKGIIVTCFGCFYTTKTSITIGCTSSTAKYFILSSTT